MLVTTSCESRRTFLCVTCLLHFSYTFLFFFFTAPLCLQEICYLDQVLEAASEIPTNGDAAPFQHSSPITVGGNTPSVCVSTSPSPTANTAAVVVVEGQRQTIIVHQGETTARTNGHGLGDGPRFELRAFHEEKRPAKLFTPGEEQQQVRVTRRRPTEEVSDAATNILRWILVTLGAGY